MSAAGDARPGSAAGPVQQGLKEALIETLTAILSPVQEVRAAAEEQIKVLEVTEGEWKLWRLQWLASRWRQPAECCFVSGLTLSVNSANSRNVSWTAPSPCS